MYSKIIFMVFFYQVTSVRYINYEESLNNIINFPCKIPQPRSIFSHLLFSDSKLKYNLIPHSTVLYTCDDSSGCCDNKLECSVDKYEINTYVFLNLLNNEYTSIDLVNHTSCICK
ncbi:PDGF- and VEGF-related factor 2 [Alphaentomopoxvirus acuprea]|uniref:PDGF-and VEGF-related factor 2 n=1 Tax=Alphaentomopoxvirus acuprea TaxID=62099 RepID=W6JLN0_9POXV|nr:PDGF- and VEGF-related factor 2 [Anomala cuprea entomopoxvirus]BAO49556.1 PDGF- and VEGF-related factor 2 [Anomala cuprea entomopoxvirus]